MDCPLILRPVRSVSRTGALETSPHWQPEVELLTANAANDQDAALFEVAAFTGLRLGEMRGWRWADVDRNRRLVHMRRSYTRGEEGPPKSGKVRSVPLVDQAARALDSLSRRERFTGDEDRVFVNALGEPFEESAMRRRFYAALDAAEPPRIRFHDLRHNLWNTRCTGVPAYGCEGLHGPRGYPDDDDLRPPCAPTRRGRQALPPAGGEHVG